MSEVIKIKIKEIKPGKQLDGQYGPYQQVWVIADTGIWYSATSTPSLAEDLSIVKTWRVGDEITVECKTSKRGDKTYRNIKPLKESTKTKENDSEILKQLEIINHKLEEMNNRLIQLLNDQQGIEEDIKF
jgi:hypothetical protein